MYIFNDTSGLLSRFCGLNHCRFDAHTSQYRSGGRTLMFTIVCVHFYDTSGLLSRFCGHNHCKFDAHTSQCRLGGRTLMYTIVFVFFLRHFRSGQSLSRPLTLQIRCAYSTVSLERAHFDVFNRLCTFFTTFRSGQPL